MEQLKCKSIFTSQLENSNVPYHSRFVASAGQPMRQLIQKYLPKPRLRSKKWISTSILDEEMEKQDTGLYANADYFVNNLVSPVYFYDQLQKVPSDAIVIEVGPHAVFRKIVSETLESSTFMSLIKKDSNDTNLENFLTVITQLYQLGINPSIDKLYPEVEFPVSRGTASIGSLMKWERSGHYHMDTFPDKYCQATSSDLNVTVDLRSAEDAFYSGHSVDDNVLFPATGFLMLAWKAYAASIAQTWNNVPVIFEHVQFNRALFLNEQGITKLKVIYSRKKFDFVIMENDNVCCQGKVHGPGDETFMLLQDYYLENLNKIDEYKTILTKDDIYKDLRVRGYDYSGEFQKLREIRTNDFQTILGECEWNGNMVAFLDNMLQAHLLSTPLRDLMFPVMIKNIRIDPKVLFDAIRLRRSGDCSRYQQTNQNNMNAYEIFQENFSIFESSITILFNAQLKLLVASGVEIEKITAHSRPLKMPSSLVLDSYEWVPNEDNSAINECDKQYINQYIEVILL